MSIRAESSNDPRDALGYLLKHASAQFTAMADAALVHHGIDSKELGVLRVLARHEPTSQLSVAETLGIDRTTMVALLDGLEHKGIVSRRPDPSDRRRNVAELTAEGKRVHSEAVVAYRAAEAGFLGALATDEQHAFRRTLRALVVDPAYEEVILG